MSLSFQLQSPISTSAEALYQWHASGGAFERLCPPWQDIRVTQWAGGAKTSAEPVEVQFGDISTGTCVYLKNHLGPFFVRIEAEHVAHQTGSFFIDEMRRGPFSYWRHTHRFTPCSNGESILDDSIEFELPLRPLSWFANDMMTKEIARMFAFRHWRTQRDIDLHQRWNHKPRRTVLIVGDDQLALQLGAFLKNGGHSVHYISERPLACRSHTVFGALAPAQLSSLSIDSIVFSTQTGKRHSRDVFEKVMQSVLIDQVKVSVYLGERPMQPQDLQAPIRHIYLRLPSIWDGGYLCFHNRSRSSVAPGWCALDDVLGGVEEMLFDERWEGAFDWSAPSPIDFSLLRSHGVGVRGLPFRVPYGVFNLFGLSLFNHAQSVEPLDYCWVDDSFFSKVF
ncbi:MAG: SRPBCC family protein [Myxococcota bacterium]|nr:SRPBCC family protein [Myxococcota bacterium]